MAPIRIASRLLGKVDTIMDEVRHEYDIMVGKDGDQWRFVVYYGVNQELTHSEYFATREEACGAAGTFIQDQCLERSKDLDRSEPPSSGAW